MVARGWASAWWAGASGGVCPVCQHAQEALSSQGAGCARSLALDLLVCPDPRGQAIRTVEVLAACMAGEVSLLVPEGPASWLVLTSSDPRLRNDLLLGSERRPELVAVRRDALPVLPDPGASGRTSAVLPVFRDPGTSAPCVLLLESSGPSSLDRLALEMLAAHLLLHRLTGGDAAGVASRLGLRPPVTMGGPDWLECLPLPAVQVDRDGHLNAVNSAASWLLQRTGVPPSKDPGPLVTQPPRPWLGSATPWEANLLVGGRQVEVRGWSSAGADGTFLVLLERAGGDESGAHDGHLRLSLQAKVNELEAANRRLEELARLRTRFVSDAAHELKTPLTILRSYLDALTTDLAEGLDHQREFLAAATEGARRLQRLVEELLDLAALESGNLPLDMGPVDAPTCLRGIFDELAPLAHLGGVELRLGPLAAITVRADPTRLAQVLRNLVDNALKYTPPGGLVRLTCRRRGESGVLEVTDNGVGIPTNELPRIFDEFHRVRRLPVAEGAGLGLAIVRRLVQTLGGHIEVASQPDAGSRFAVELPVWTPEP